MEEVTHNRQQPAPQAPPRNQVSGGGGVTTRISSRGPRNLWLPRGDHGFGFTLRHFIVYPPEPSPTSSAMDTIFIKNVSGAAAKLAGLTTGDRVVGVNGQTTAGKTYEEVVRMIYNTPERLHLLVVPKEDDIIQQCFSDAAHNPYTNARPMRMRSPPEMTSTQQRHSGICWSPSPTASYTNNPEPIYYAPTYDTSVKTTTATVAGGAFDSLGRRIVQINPNNNRLNISNSSISNDSVSVISSSSSLSSNRSTQPGCRLSLDGGRLLSGYTQLSSSSCNGSVDSSSSTLTDDSHIISRILKSCAQKKEFLENSSGSSPTVQSNNVIQQREFYSRPPQRINCPAWPPSPSTISSPTAVKSKPPPLSKIHEHSGATTESFDSDTGASIIDRPRLQIRSRSEEKEVTLHRNFPQPQIHVVSNLTREFETGQVHQEPQRIAHYSELKRLSSKLQPAPKVSQRKQEFEQRGTIQQVTADRTSAASTPTLGGNLSGNRTLIVGSSTIHAIPPADYKPDLSADVDNSAYITRPRSNSVESWSSHDDSHKHHHKQQRKEGSQMQIAKGMRMRRGRSSERMGDDKQRHKAVRQDSYLAAVKTLPTPTAVPDTSTVPNVTPVTHRVRASHLSTDERGIRRISYVKATSDDSNDLNNDHDHDHDHVKAPSTPQQPPSANKSDVKQRSAIATDTPEDQENVIKEGSLNCKLSLVEGKRATDRSWKQIWATLRGPLLSMTRDRDTIETIHLAGCRIDVPPLDVNKKKIKKHVVRVQTPTDTEYLLQAEDAVEMEQWRIALSEQSTSSRGKEGDTSHAIDMQPEDEDRGVAVVSPTHKGFMKLASNLRTRSPTGQSPVTKTRKSVVAAQTTSTSDSHQTQVGSPKTKTWKGKLGKPFRRIGGGSNSPSSPTGPCLTLLQPPTGNLPEGATMGVPLECCPPSASNELVPLLVERCTSIVEARGLDIVGVYRVPGNTAAVTALTDAINRGLHNVSSEDPRWNDVNVISSLLKSFFRNLPDSLFTADLYPKFIEADKIPDPKERMLELRKLLEELPEHNYETLKHLLQHLKRVVGNSEVNKMETKNLAIVFGPTLVRPADLLALVHDTPQQCHIIESLITHVDWFFSNDSVDCLDEVSLSTGSGSTGSADLLPKSSANSTNLLLNNLHRIEGRDAVTRDLVSTLISAANRKISRKPKKVEKIGDTTTSTTLEKTTRISSSNRTEVVVGSLSEDTTDAILTNNYIQNVPDWVVNPNLKSPSPQLNIIDLRKSAGSCESLHKPEDNNVAFKKFKSSRENCSSSYESLNANPDHGGSDLLTVITENFDQKLQELKNQNETKQDETIPSEPEKAEHEKNIDTSDEKTNEEDYDDCLLVDSKAILNILRPKNIDSSTTIPKTRLVKRSESLNSGATKGGRNLIVRRSESLGKGDMLSKWEKTETNLLVKQLMTRSSRAGGGGREKENGGGGKRKGIKRRHTVGGAKDFDQWEQRERSRGLRTSSPDLSTSSARLQHKEIHSIEVSLLGTEGIVLAKVRQELKPSQASQRLPAPLESHV